MPRIAIAATVLLVGILATVAHERITTKITFNKEIVRIFEKNCMSCHSAGGFAPMALTTYAEVRPWAKAIKEEVLERRMPPWNAVAGYGEFSNDASLSSRDLDLITAWVDGGAPKGEDKDLPSLPDFSKPWPLGLPDLVLQPSSPFTLTGEGGDEHHCFVLSNPSAKDRWVRGIDFNPGVRDAVQQAFVSIDRDGKPEQAHDCSSAGAGAGILWSWHAGQRAALLPRGQGFFLPAGSNIKLSVHYRQPDGEAQDLSKIGFYFSDRPLAARVREIAIVNHKFEIPPEAPSFPVKTSYMLRRDVEAISIQPRMNLLGKSIEVRAVRPNGSTEILVWVRDYDPGWQRSYTFKKPIPLPRGTRIEVSAYYDNTSGNPRNPHQPPQLVRPPAELCAAYLRYTSF
jgi:hypothetical protein